MTRPASSDAAPVAERRAFLGSSVALASVIAATALPAAAQEQGPIEQAYPEWVRLSEIWDAASIRLCEAEERYEQFEQPAQPKYRMGSSEGSFKSIPTEPGFCRVVISDHPDNIAKLRAMVDEPSTIVDCEEWQARRSRNAKATLDAIVGWQNERSRLREAAGLPEAEAGYEAAYGAVRAFESQMLDVEPTTFRELAFQAALIPEAWTQERADMVIERLMRLAGISERVALNEAAA